MLYCVVYKLTLQLGSAQLLYFCTYYFYAYLTTIYNVVKHVFDFLISKWH